jgi:hypothetical protein
LQVEGVVKDTAREKFESAMKAVRKRFNMWGDSLPRCADTCDGDVEGGEHDADCPVGKAGGFATMFDAYAAGRAEGIEELRKALRALIDSAEYQRGTVYELSTYDIEKAEAALAKDGQ